MKKTFEFGLPQVPYFEQPRNGFLPKLSDSTITYYEDGMIQLVEEYIDYHQAMLYRIQAWATETYSISIETKGPDYHLLYPVEVSGTISLKSMEPISYISLSYRQATYAYIPKGKLIIEAEQGTYLLYGLLIDIGMIREVLYNDNHFLSDFRRAGSRNEKLLYQSPLWPIKEKTLYQLEYIETVLFSFRKEHEGKVVELIYNLFDIAVEKQFVTYEMLHEGEELARRARVYIHEQVTKTFSDLSIGYIHQRLGVTPQYLAREHKKYNRETMSEYRDRLLLEKAKQLLLQYTINEVSYYCGFKQASSFSDYFFKHIRMRPIQYKNMVLGKRKE